ncbi:RPS27A [Symbiodinium necroappetens]|uniref:RPS27A protein n=1 Tax=Symbiodinium necroappetens TaxID=1628268 RepID=A0A812TIF9_9DINO|nr:RPS27A [Symbiodinium necroappetens]
MRVFVRDVVGDTRLVECSPDTNAGALKVQVAGAAAEELSLLFGGSSLSDEVLLSECGVEEDSTLFLSAELCGGGKKRKKKTYTKPKKIKHKRKKVKLAVLKFYKVDSNDKVTRLRRECPHETCGPGVFMAMHFNRYYCGKCHLTYLIKKDRGSSSRHRALCSLEPGIRLEGCRGSRRFSSQRKLGCSVLNGVFLFEIFGVIWCSEPFSL